MVGSGFPPLPVGHTASRSPVQIDCDLSNLPSLPTSEWEETVFRALVAVLAAHSGEDEVAIDVAFRDGPIRRIDVATTKSTRGVLDSSRSRTDTAVSRAQTLLAFSDKVDPPYPLVVSASTPGSLTVASDPVVLPLPVLRWLVEHLTTALVSLAPSLGREALDPVPLVSPSERKELLRLASADIPPVEVAYPGCKTLHSVILGVAEEQPDATAITWSDIDSTSSSFDISFSQLVTLSHTFALALLQCRAQARSPVERFVVAVTAEKAPLIVPCLLGILRAAAAYVFIEPDTPDERKRDIVDQCGASFVVVADDSPTRTETWAGPVAIIRATEALGTELALLRERGRLPSPPSGQLPTVGADDLAYCIFTSGSTGRPKGIGVTHANVVSFLRNYRGRFQRRGVGERVLQFPSFAFDVVVMNVWDTLAHRSTVCMTTRTALHSDLASCVSSLGITSADLTPTVASLLLEHATTFAPSVSPREAWVASGLGSFRHLNTGAEPVPPWLRKAFLDRGVSVLVDYGPSETTVGVISSLTLPGDRSVERADVGRPTGRNRIFILDDQGRLTPLGCIGEICVAGDQVTPGYLDPSLNADVFTSLAPDPSKPDVVERIYHTGDLGRYVVDGSEGYGSIECLGRKDLQVKISGLRIEIGEIEHRINSAPDGGIRRAVVDKLERDDLPSGLVAFFELKSHGDKVDDVVSKAKAHLAQALPAYMVPTYWLPVETIPRQTSGKTDRKALRQLALAHDFRASARVTPNGDASMSRSTSDQGRRRDRFDDAVATAWAKALKVDPVGLGPEDEFVMLGGDSIAFIRVAAALRAQGFRASFGALIAARTLADCADVLRQAGSAASTNGVHSYTAFDLLQGQKQQALLELADQHGIDADDVEDLLPTAPAQEAILAAATDSDLYYSQAVYKLDLSSGLTARGVARGLEELVRRRPMLRTGFALLQSMPSILQIVFKAGAGRVEADCRCPVVEVDSDAELEAALEDFVAADRAGRSFAWGKLHLSLRIFACRSSNAAKLVWGLHHAQSDGWALELLMTDLARLCAGEEPDERPAYGDFVRWWRTVDTEGRDAANVFWRRYLYETPSARWPALPKQRSGFVTSRAVRCTWSGPLQTLSKHGITPAIASRVACGLALAALADSSDVCLGVVRSGRDVDVAGAEDMAGCCVSALPTRMKLDPTATLVQVLKDEAGADREVRRHQKVTLSQIAQIASAGGRDDVFRTLVTYQSLAERPQADREKMPIRQPPDWIKMPSNYALSLEITPTARDGLALEAFFDDAAVTETVAEEVLETMAKLLTAMCEDVDQTVSAAFSRVGIALPPASTSAPSQRDRISRTTEASEGGDGRFVDQVSTAWRSVLRLDEADVPLDVSFASLGGDSLAMMRLSVALKKADLAIPISLLPSLATVREQSRWLAARM